MTPNTPPMIGRRVTLTTKVSPATLIGQPGVVCRANPSGDLYLVRLDCGGCFYASPDEVQVMTVGRD